MSSREALYDMDNENKLNTIEKIEIFLKKHAADGATELMQNCTLMKEIVALVFSLFQERVITLVKNLANKLKVSSLEDERVVDEMRRKTTRFWNEFRPYVTNKALLKIIQQKVYEKRVQDKDSAPKNMGFRNGKLRSVDKFYKKKPIMSEHEMNKLERKVGPTCQPSQPSQLSQPTQMITRSKRILSETKSNYSDTENERQNKRKKIGKGISLKVTTRAMSMLSQENQTPSTEFNIISDKMSSGIQQSASYEEPRAIAIDHKQVHAMHKEWCKTIPWATHGTYSKKLARRVKKLDAKLKTKLRISKAHKGVTLAATSVTSEGLIHWNKSLMNCPELQKEILEVTAAVINAAYGRKKWYRDFIAFFEKPENSHMQKYFLPGIPCSNIWWSVETQSLNRHIDHNEIGAGFLFVPRSFKGGELVLNHPTAFVQRSVHVKPTHVIAGRYSRSPHYNLPVHGDGTMTSFKVFLDSRVVSCNCEDPRNKLFDIKSIMKQTREENGYIL